MSSLRVVTLAFLLGWLASDLAVVSRLVAWALTVPHPAVTASVAAMLLATTLLVVLPMRRMALLEASTHSTAAAARATLSAAQHLARRSSF